MSATHIFIYFIRINGVFFFFSSSLPSLFGRFFCVMQKIARAHDGAVSLRLLCAADCRRRHEKFGRIRWNWEMSMRFKMHVIMKDCVGL